MKKFLLTTAMFIVASLGLVNAQGTAQDWGKPTGSTQKARYMTLFAVYEYSEGALAGNYEKNILTYNAPVSFFGDVTDTGVFYVLPRTLEVEQGQKVTFRVQATQPMKWTQLRMFADWNINYNFDDEGELFKVVGTKKNGNGNDLNKVIFHYTIPENAKEGETRIRIQYNDGWFKKDEPDYKNTAMDNIENGRVYDVKVIVKAKKQEAVATPVFTPVAGSNAVEGPLKVTLACETEGATIKYTLDNTDPTSADAMVYDSQKGIELTQTTTIKAIAIKEGMANSEVATATYTIMQQVAEPTFTPDADTEYTGTVSVEIMSATEGAKIIYTLDGKDPENTSDAMVFEKGKPIKLEATTTIKAMAVKEGMSNSKIATATYTVIQQVAEPTFTPDADTEYTEAVSVEIMSATEGAKIIYTLDGKDPENTPNAMVFEKGKPIKLEATTTIKAMAVKDGMKASAIVTKTFTINIKSSINDVNVSPLSVYKTNSTSLTIEYNKPATAYLYSVSGKLLKTIRLNGTTNVDLSNTEKGVLILNVEGNSVKVRH